MTSPLTPQSECQCPACGRRIWIDTITLLTGTTVCPTCLVQLNRTGRHTNPAYRERETARPTKYESNHSSSTAIYTNYLDASHRADILDAGMCDEQTY